MAFMGERSAVETPWNEACASHVVARIADLSAWVDVLYEKVQVLEATVASLRRRIAQLETERDG